MRGTWNIKGQRVLDLVPIAERVPAGAEQDRVAHRHGDSSPRVAHRPGSSRPGFTAVRIWPFPFGRCRRCKGFRLHRRLVRQAFPALPQVQGQPSATARAPGRQLPAPEEGRVMTELQVRTLGGIRVKKLGPNQNRADRPMQGGRGG